MRFFCQFSERCFSQKAPKPGQKIFSGPNAFVPASIHNIGFSVKNIVNDIYFQTAKKEAFNILWLLCAE